MSYYLTQEVTAGDVLTITGPLWHLTDDKTHDKYLLISVWSGITPILSHYTHLVEQTDRKVDVVQIFGERTADHILPEMHEAFALQTDSIHNIVTLSREKKEWYATGYIQEHIDTALAYVQSTQMSVFICGKQEMCTEVRKILEEKGIDPQNIKHEAY